MTLREKLLAEAAAFCAEVGMSEARLATIVVNNGKLFQNMRKGGDCTTRTLEKFERYFAETRAARQRRAS